MPSPPPQSLVSSVSDRVGDSIDDVIEETRTIAVDDAADGGVVAINPDDAIDEIVAIGTTGAAGKKEGEQPLPDFGGMGWRFCKWTVRKVRHHSVIILTIQNFFAVWYYSTRFDLIVRFFIGK